MQNCGGGRERSGLWVAKVLLLFRIGGRGSGESQEYALTVYGSDMLDRYSERDAWLLFSEVKH